MFTKEQLEKLVLRMRQTPDELLADRDYADSPGRYKFIGDKSNPKSVLGVAHVDYVIWGYPHFIEKGGDVCCLGGQVDDRVGVWMMLDVLPSLLEFDILLTNDEEKCNSTASDFLQSFEWENYENPKNYNWCFSFDRRGTDAVIYNSDKKFGNAVKKHLILGRGTYSDIKELPWNGVNVGSGYYGEHTDKAYVNLNHLWSQVQKFLGFFNQYSLANFGVKSCLSTNSTLNIQDTRKKVTMADSPITRKN